MEVTKPIKVGNYWTNLVDTVTGENVNFEEVTTWVDGTPMDDSKADGVIYRKLPASVGGGYVKRCWSGAFKMKWAGVSGDGVTDNTDAYNRVIPALAPNTQVEWEANGVYVGSFVSDKPFTLNFNSSTLVNPSNTQPPIRVEGDVDFEFGTVISPVSYGDIYFETNQAGGLAPEDLVFIYDEKLRPADSAPMINTELLKVKEIDGNKVYVYDIIRSDQNTGTITLGKVTPIKDVYIKDVNIECVGLNSAQVIFLQGIENLGISNVNINHSDLMAITSRYSYNISVDNITIRNPLSIEVGGRGYGVHCQHSRNISVSRIDALGTRHAVDFNSCYTGVLRGVKASGGNLAQVVVAHNTFGGNFQVYDILQEGGSGCVEVSDQGLPGASDKVNHVTRDILIDNVQHIISSEGYAAQSNKDIRTVFLGTSTSNVVVKSARTQLVGNLESFELDVSHNTIRLYGVPIGPTLFDNVSANKIGSLIRFTSNVITPGSMPLHENMTISNMSVDNCIVGIIVGGCKHITIDGFNYNGDASENEALIRLTQAGNTPHTTKLDVYGLNYGTATILDMPGSYSGILLEGGIHGDKITVPIDVTPAFVFSADETLKMDKVIMDNPSGSSVNANNDLFPRPVFASQRILIEVVPDATSAINLGLSPNNMELIGKTTSRLGRGNKYLLAPTISSGGSAVWTIDSISSVINDGFLFNTGGNSLTGLPNTGGTITSAAAPNGTAFTFNGPNAASTVVLTYNYMADRFRLLTFQANNQLRYQADIITSQMFATTTVAGIVEQSNAVTDVSTTDSAPTAAPDASDEATAITLVNDLKTKYNDAVVLINELKTKLNEKLAVDRDSGQQTT